MENVKDENLNSSNEAEESSTSDKKNEENSVEENEEQGEDNEDNENDSGLLAKKNKQLFARAKKAEEELKELKSSKKGQSLKKEPKDQSKISEEEILDKASLLNQGYSREDLAKLDKIKRLEESDGNEISLMDAAKTDYFVAWKEMKEKEAKAKKAQLGASKRGSNSSSKKKPLSREEHKEAVKSWKFVD